MLNSFVASGEPEASSGVSLASIDGVACADVDHDGDVDLFLSGAGVDYLFVNQLVRNAPTPADWYPNGIPAFSRDNRGIVGGGDGEGSVFADVDRDGDLDLYINQDGGNELWINPTNDTNYLVVRAVIPAPAARDAIGATVTLKDANARILGSREINGGKGHGSQSMLRGHFGLPLGANVNYQVEVRFPEAR